MKQIKKGKITSLSDKYFNKALEIFNCSKSQTRFFEEKDPFNEGNCISGFICNKEGNHSGSLYIVSTNGEELNNPILIWGV